MIDYELLRAEVARHPYPLLFATVSGAHLYGFPSPDSDYDLRGAHVLPATEAVGLLPKRETIEFSGLRDGVEMDMVTHDVLKFFAMVLKRNGYVLEQLRSPLVVHTSPEHQELKDIAAACVTRHHSHHYVRVRRHTVKFVPEGRAAAGKAAAICLSCAPHWHPPDAYGEG